MPRTWINSILYAIRHDFARPPVHARNLHHLTVGMYDAWAVYEPNAETAFLGQDFGGFTAPFDGVETIADSASRADAQEMAIAYFGYRLIKHRFVNAPGAFFTFQYVDSLMNDFGYDVSITSTNYLQDGPAAMGNYIAQQLITFGLQDGSNESGNYAYTSYTPGNPPIMVEQPGNPTMVDPTRWQPISLTAPVDQAGNPIPSTPNNLGPEWGDVQPYALTEIDASYHVRDGHTYRVFHNPGVPPYLDTLNQTNMENFFKWNFVLVSMWQSHHDPNDPTVWDISPNSIGNISSYPQNWTEYDAFYDLFNGGDPGTGYAVNPITGVPYTPQMVKRSDYARVLAEFWADGLDSETPPGHWFEIYDHISEHPMFETKWKGNGPDLSWLEYDTKAYLTLGAAMHDAAISAWSIKGWYDYPRPVSIIRYLADQGQSTAPFDLNYDPQGIPLVPGYVELVYLGDPLAGAGNEHVGKIKLYTWRGPDYIADPQTDHAGVGWILAENWWPYQRPSFVSPPFAGYVSGHSTFSSAAAEVLTFITGSPFFPGGMSDFTATQNEFLQFEEGPTQTVVLQWAKYKDAADQCSLSRIWGGIHVPIDDIPGRLIGESVGQEVSIKADSTVALKIPTAIALTSNDPIINASDIASQLILTVTYDSLMNVAVDPMVSFPLTDPTLSALTFVSGTWTSGTTFELVYDIPNSSIELSDIYIKVDSAQSIFGTYQKKAVFNPVFFIDTKLPVMDSAIVSTSIINSTMNGSQVIVDYYFSEPCDPAALNFTYDPMLAAYDLSANASSGWLSDTQYRLIADITINAEVIQNVDLIVNTVYDYAGNALTFDSAYATVLIDTEIPFIVSWQDDQDTLNLFDVGSSYYNLDLTFSKSMDQSYIPTAVILNSAMNGILTPLSENIVSSQWSSPTELHLVFDALSMPIIEEVDLSISLDVLSDLSGNLITNEQIPIQLIIDNRRPEIVSSIPHDLVIDEFIHQNQDMYVDIVFDEAMDPAYLPLVQCHQGGVVMAQPAFDPFGSTWLFPNTYRTHFTLPNIDMQFSSVGIKVSLVKDVYGNPMLDYESGGLFDIDYMASQAGINEQANSAIRVYPNPLKLGNELTIDSGSDNLLSINIIDLMGREVYVGQLNNGPSMVKLNLSQDLFSQGIYYLRVQTNSSNFEYKLVIAE